MKHVNKKSYNAYKEHTMTNLAKLKTTNDLDRLLSEINKITNPSKQDSNDDPRFWKVARDKSGNGSAIIRFLPACAADGDALPWVRVWDHGFKGPTGKWYIEKSLTTLDQKDPVSELNSKLWNSGSDDSPERKQARAQKRRLTYISNIYVVSDPKNPENEGKVFLFRYGKKIFDKMLSLMKPEFAGDTPVNPFHLFKGANFKLRVRMVDGYPNYDMSLFDPVSAISSDDDEIERIYAATYSLKEFVDPKKFKTYAELEAKLNEVMGTTPEASVVQTPIRTQVEKPVNKQVTKSTQDEDDYDPDLDEFQKLVD